MMSAFGPAQVRVHLVDVERVEPARLARERLAWLAPEERQRYDRLVFAEKKHEFLVTRALVRAVLAPLVGEPPAALAFDLGPYGRPELRGAARSGRSLRFNLSNTHGLVACAVAWDRDVGVDVEFLERRTETTSVADRFFSPSEVAALVALPEAHRRRRFFELWTLKEAYIKARGLGLAIPLASFSFGLDHVGPPTIAFAPSLPDDPATWRFEQFYPSSEHAMALATRVAPGEALRVDLEWRDDL